MRSENWIIRRHARQCYHFSTCVHSYRDVETRVKNHARDTPSKRIFFLNSVSFGTKKKGERYATRFSSSIFRLLTDQCGRLGEGRRGNDYATLRSRHLLRWGIFFSPCRVTIRVRVIQRNFGLAYSRLWIPCVSGEHVRGRRDAISSVGVAGASFGLSLCRFIFDLAARSQGRIAPSAFPVFEKHSPLSLYLFTQWTNTFRETFIVCEFFLSLSLCLSRAPIVPFVPLYHLLLFMEISV